MKQIVVLLEDDVALSANIVELFHISGIACNSYNNIYVFLGELNRVKFNVLIVDHFLKSNDDGLLAVRKVKDKYPYCKVILISGTTDLDVINKYIDVGIDHFVSKADMYFSEKLVRYVKSHRNKKFPWLFWLKRLLALLMLKNK